MRLAVAQAVVLAVLSCAAFAQSLQLSAAIAAGQVGERVDGYMGFAAPVSEEVRRQVIGINIKRRSLYTEVAAQRGVTVALVGLTTACVLFRDLPAGEAYQLEDSTWRRRLAGSAPPIPAHCR